MCGLILWNATAICAMLKTSWQTGKPPCERRFGESCKGSVIPFGAMVEYHPISSWTSQGSISLVSFTWNIPRTCVDREETWKGHIMMADIEEMENLDSSEIHPRRLNATEVSTPQRRGKLLDSKPQMKQLNCLEETAESENPL